MDKPTVVPLNPASAEEKLAAETLTALHKLEQNAPMIAELLLFQIKQIKLKYTLALAQGFTEAQALQLCISRWE